MTYNTRKELLKLAAILSIVAIALTIRRLYFQEYKPRKIKVGVAKIIAVTPRAQKEERRIYFAFDISDTCKLDTCFQSIEAWSFDQLTGMVGKTAPIMYDSNDRSYKWVLFRISEYKRYNVKVTDSSLLY